jgi:hypothetical protein
VGEEDYNFDGKPELIRFAITAQSRFPVNSFKMLLQFSYTLQVGQSVHTPAQPSDAVLNSLNWTQRLAGSVAVVCRSCGMSHASPAGSQRLVSDTACCYALLLFMQGAVHLKMYGLAYLTASSPQPGSSFSADGEVSTTL